MFVSSWVGCKRQKFKTSSLWGAPVNSQLMFALHIAYLIKLMRDGVFCFASVPPGRDNFRPDTFRVGFSFSLTTILFDADIFLLITSLTRLRKKRQSGVSIFFFDCSVVFYLFFSLLCQTVLNICYFFSCRQLTLSRLGRDSVSFVRFRRQEKKFKSRTGVATF